MALVCAGLTACASSGSPASSRGVGTVVAAENVWGSVAAQLAGDKATVRSIVDNPDADPHDYEPTAADARLVATAGVVIENGIGYDAWAQKMIAANPSAGRAVLNVGSLVGVPPGGNPHQWYSPESVRRVVDAIAAAYAKRDPPNAAFFEAQRERFLTSALHDYTALVESIRTEYGGVPVGASESVFSPLAAALGLRLITPAPFLKAISEGADPSAADKATIDRQIEGRAIKVYVFNSQNATPDVQRQIEACRRKGIPLATVTETLVPAGATFQQWQTAQLTALRAALARATGR